MEGDDDEGLRRGGGEKAKSLGKKTDEAEADYTHHRCKLDLGFNISISIRERGVRQGIEKHNLRHSFHVSLLWSSHAFWQQKRRRRGEGKKAAEEGIRSSSDSFSPSFLVYSLTPPQPRNTPGSPQNLWSDNMLENPGWNRTKLTLSILRVSQYRSYWWPGWQPLHCHHRHGTHVLLRTDANPQQP